MSLSYDHIAIDAVQPARRNARTHSPKQIAQIAESIRTFGFTNPLLIDEADVLIAGHGRLEAAKSLGLKTVPAIRIPNLSEPAKRALMLADNKIALNAGWDLDILADELADLSSMELEFDLATTGFEVAEIDLIIDASRDDAAVAEEALEPDRTLPAVTQPGDLWQLGPHRVLCGTARSSEDYASLMQGDLADVGFTDPPYNVPITGHVSGKGRVSHREFAEASGEMSEEAFTAFLTETLQLAARNSREGAVWFAFMDWRHLGEMRTAGLTAFGTWLNLCVWAKTNGGMGSLYRSQHELVFVFRNGTLGHRNNVQLGRFGRNRTNLWSYPGVNTFRKDRMSELQAHPTAKPLAMIRDALLDVSKRGDIVLDPFLGAGATLIAAERSGRIARGLEIDPLYVDVVLRRWRAETGEEPVRASDGRSLADLEAGQ
ncbi:site-specific DNA-methyltransferase [Marivita geojedonensis]|uniref:Methyltransferase n=1 Tax=Marivita geojedonensis TaxID=1123756 RepID=A0A1X4NM05_9RHOB|nr:DNA methyltransferase [Marivita geojedonensis]OSQ51368.1 DNA methylase N-4 [Marivita geojedonensis]PRY77974.1 DNA modification methylase [Marivita geojedonensis]